MSTARVPEPEIDACPYEGMSVSGPNDDRRTPVLWNSKGIGKIVVDPSDRKEWASPNYFRDELAVKSLKPGDWDKYDHYGLVPKYAHPDVWRQSLPEGVRDIRTVYHFQGLSDTHEVIEKGVKRFSEGPNKQGVCS